MRTIAVANQKGGCGKTTTAINLASALAKKDKRVLIVDLDPQSHTTLGFGYDPEKLTKTIYNALTLTDAQNQISKVIVNTNIESLKLAPSNILLAGAEMELSLLFGREFVLSEQLNTIKDAYDICIIDCPPSLGLLTLNALVASTDVIVPVQAHYYAMEGLKQLLQTVNVIQERFHPCYVKILGLLLTFMEPRARLSKDISGQMRSYFGELVFSTEIHRSIKLAEAPSAGESIITYSPSSKGAVEYKALAEEILNGRK